MNCLFEIDDISVCKLYMVKLVVFVATLFKNIHSFMKHCDKLLYLFLNNSILIMIEEEIFERFH